MGTNFCATVALAEETPWARSSALVKNLLLFGVLQGVFAVLSPEKFLMMAAAALMIAGLALRRHANQSGAVFSAAMLNVRSGSVQQGIDLLALAVGIAITAAPLFYGLDRFFFRTGSWRGTGFQPPLDRSAACRRIAAVLTAMALFETVSWTFGSWILTTVVLSYTGGRTGKAVWQQAAFRLRWALAGFLLSVLYLSTISYANAALNDLAALLLFAAAYFALRAKIYVNYYLLFVISMSFIKNLTYGDDPVYGNGWELVVQSTAAVLTGIAIIAVVEAPVRETPHP